MRKHTELRLEPWTVIVAVVLVALIGFMLSRMGGMKPTEMNAQAMMVQSMNSVDKALEQVDAALEHTNEALQTPDLATLQMHIQLAQGALEGQGSAMMNMQMMQEMMQGPMMTMAQQGMMGMSMEHHANMMAALQAAQSNMEGALEHFGEAVKADKLETAQEHVRLSMDQLQAARGIARSTDPKAGGLTYLKEQMTQMMGQMKQ
ncbi:MAG: hypothetical protein A2Z21_09255 [Candidatus Fraserbacteria bacterium RBG_16_55_9]|uniref:Uncharacterized protein n=1 Tax=Fraserbacteria sp. (strain RBG_16_55_9) TaxID=1817864 RepID=A0A1F5UY54_FRAXR|nr:MAG: hypothetical protein A2Z21_09255 [Candidatus Fraserbacteria bacterium RBG_16_55_9]